MLITPVWANKLHSYVFTVATSTGSNRSPEWNCCRRHELVCTFSWLFVLCSGFLLHFDKLPAF